MQRRTELRALAQHGCTGRRRPLRAKNGVPSFGRDLLVGSVAGPVCAVRRVAYSDFYGLPEHVLQALRNTSTVQPGLRPGRER